MDYPHEPKQFQIRFNHAVPVGTSPTPRRRESDRHNPYVSDYGHYKPLFSALPGAGRRQRQIIS